MYLWSLWRGVGSTWQDALQHVVKACWQYAILSNQQWQSVQVTEDIEPRQGEASAANISMLHPMTCM